MSVTLKEIARHTGLSVPTVGNVLGRAAHRYSETTRKQVIQAAAELGYMPNSSARAVQQGRFDCAALVLSRSKQQSHSFIPVGLLDGLDEELALHGMHLTVSRLSDEQLTDQSFLPKVLREYMADGMIVNYTHEIPLAMLELIRTHHTPAVWINNKLDRDCVYPDDFLAAKDATEQLLKIGHKRIAYLHMMPPQPAGMSWDEFYRREHYSVFDRWAGYSTAMRSAGQTPQIVGEAPGGILEADRLGFCKSILADPDRPTAVIVYSDHDLSTVMTAAASLGLEIPKELSVLVFYPIEPWVCGRRVSCVPLPTTEIGRRAARMLFSKLDTPDEPCPPQIVEYRADLRDTVGPPPVKRRTKAT